MTDAFSEQWTVTKPAVASRGGVVAAQNQKAARAGVEILDAGGNAIDAAVATSMALGATEPWMSGIGGIGTMIVHMAESGADHAIDFGAISPRRLDPWDYPLTGGEDADLFGWPAVLENRNVQGPLSIAVPGLVAGMGLARDRFGTMPWHDLLQPALRLAREGLEVDWWSSIMTSSAARDLRRYPSSRRIWLPDDLPPVPDSNGARIFLPLGRLADTLQELARSGPASFYRGDLARRLVADMAALGGVLGQDDLESYEARVREPLSLRHGNARIAAMPGLFAGSTLGRCLELLGGKSHGSPIGAAFYTTVGLALQQAYRERLEKAGGEESPTQTCTSHFNVVDRAGNMVAVTQTLLSIFGSRVVLPSTGVLMNNGINWFDPRPGRPNSLAPAKRPLSNMCPLGVEAEGRRFAIGASGGRKILPAVLQLALFLIDHRMGLEDAFATPRIDVSGPEIATMDTRLAAPIQTALASQLGAKPYRPRAYPLGFACPSAVLRDAEGTNWSTAETMQPWAGAQAQSA